MEGLLREDEANVTRAHVLCRSGTWSIQPLCGVAHLLTADALEQTVVEIGLVLMRHDAHKAHQQTAARTMWRTDRKGLGLGIWGWHMFLRSPEMPTRKLWRQVAANPEAKIPARRAGRSQGLGDGKGKELR